jgi:serine/threonine protein kinase
VSVSCGFKTLGELSSVPREGALVPGARIGEWVVEEVLEGDGRFRCHRVDSPFRKAVLTAFRGRDRAGAEEAAGQLARLHHPNIGGVLGSAVSGDELYVVAELVQGATLRSFLRGGEAAWIPFKTAITVSHELADALATAHERGVVHGDVRPENVLLGLDGKARLVGFERMGTSDDLAAALRYAAPELSAPDARPTAASDAWSFGVLLYELFAGSDAEVAIPRDRSLTLGETVPRSLRDVVASLTHPDPVVRPALGKVRQVLLQHVLDLSQTTLDDTFRPGTETPDAPPMPARIGRYDVLRELGRGGVGVVYEGIDPVLHRRVALKLLIAGTWARPKEVQRFKLEAQAVARLDHPNIVKILDIGGDVEGAWFAMEFVDGPSLADRLKANGGRVPWREAVSVAAQIARALQHAHELGLLHRDVKPNNVLLDGDRAKLADFGLALDAERERTRLTGTGQILGTPTYMAPEQAAGEIDRLGPHTDVYGLGVLLYEALTGAVPYDGATPLQVIASILGGNAAPVRKHVPDLPRQLDTVTAKALRLEPSGRYPSAGAFADDLERLLVGDAILASDPTVGERLRRFAVRHARPITTAVVAGLVVLGVTTGGGVAASAVLGHRREQDAAQALEGTRRRIAESLAAGRVQDAEDAFRTFVSQPEHAGTVALVAAWRDRAAARAAAGDAQGRLSALSSAYLAARQPGEIEASLLALAEAAHDEREFELLLNLGELLGRRYPHLAEQVRPLVRDALAASRRLGSAAALIRDDGSARLLAELASGATPTEWREAELWGDPVRGQLFLASEGALVQVDRALGAVPGRAPLQVPHVPAVVPLRERPAVLLRRPVSDDTRLLGVTPTTFEELPPLGLGEISDVVPADLDGDGREELWIGAWRKLYRADPSPDGWTLSEPHAETNLSNSQIRGLLVGDFDGDGRQDLVAAVAEWGAYDVRLFTWDVASGGLSMARRIKLGTVSSLVATRDAAGDPVVAACKVDQYANLRVFPDSAPFGVEKGVWELGFRSDGPVRARLVHPGWCDVLRAGDLDGDGLADLAASDAVRRDTVLLRRRPDDGFDQVWLRQTRLSTVVQADDDPAEEIVVWDELDGRRTWLLGAGDASRSFPAVPAAPVPSQEPPPATATFHEAWRRADDLVSIGRLEDAQRAFRDLAGLAWGTPEGTEAVLRAADLAFARGAHQEAASLYLEADALGAPEALTAAARAVRGRDDRDELALLREAARRGALDAESAERLARLRPLEAPPMELRFDRPLDPSWTVASPLYVSRSDAQGELLLEPTGPGELLRVPVLTDARWLGVELEGAVDRTEWGAELQFGFVPRGADEPLFGAMLAGKGGGEIVERQLTCTVPGWNHGETLPDEVGVPLRLSAWIQRDGVVRCGGDGGDAPWSLGEDRDAFAWEPGAWDFVVRSNAPPTAGAAVHLQRVTLRGVGPDPGAAPGDAAARGIVEGTSTSTDPYDRLLVAVKREDVPGVVQRLGALGADPRAEQVRSWLLHARLDTYGAALRPALGADWFPRLAEAWESPLLSEGRRDPELRHMLLRWTEGAEAARPADEGARSRLQLLLLAKGGAALHQGQGATARAALERAVSFGLPESPSVEEVRWTRSWVAVGLLDLAQLAARDGESDRAFELLDRAFATTPVPIVLTDTLRARSGFESLREDPRWKARFGSE